MVILDVIMDSKHIYFSALSLLLFSFCPLPVRTNWTFAMDYRSKLKLPHQRLTNSHIMYWKVPYQEGKHSDRNLSRRKSGPIFRINLYRTRAPVSKYSYFIHCPEVQPQYPSREQRGISFQVSEFVPVKYNKLMSTPSFIDLRDLTQYKL